MFRVRGAAKPRVEDRRERRLSDAPMFSFDETPPRKAVAATAFPSVPEENAAEGPSQSTEEAQRGSPAPKEELTSLGTNDPSPHRITHSKLPGTCIAGETVELDGDHLLLGCHSVSGKHERASVGGGDIRTDSINLRESSIFAISAFHG